MLVSYLSYQDSDVRRIQEPKTTIIVVEDSDGKRTIHKRKRTRTRTPTTIDDLPKSLVLEILHRLDFKSAMRCITFFQRNGALLFQILLSLATLLTGQQWIIIVAPLPCSSSIMLWGQRTKISSCHWRRNLILNLCLTFHQAVPCNGLLFWCGEEFLVGLDPYNSGCC